MTSRSEIDLAGIKLKNPIIMASGTYGFGEEFKDFYDPKILGGISSKGITRHPKKGNDGIRIWETPSGILNSIGLENPGVEEFVKSKIHDMNKLGTEVFVNLGGNTIEEYIESAEILNDYDFAAIELNISCPNVKEGGMAFGMDKDSAAKVVREVMKVTNKKVFVKLLSISIPMLLFSFAIPAILYKSFGLNSFNFMTLVLIQAVVTISFESVHIPGGVGVIEGSMMLVYSSFMPKSLAFSIMAINRFVTFYLAVPFAGLYFLLVKTNRKNYQKNKTLIKLNQE